MNQLPFSLSNESLTIYVGGLPTTVRAGTVQYNQLREAILKDQWDLIPTLLAPGGALAKYLGDRFVAGESGTISYDGVPLPASLTGRISAMAGEGVDPSPLLRFYERLHRNPSYRSREQVFDFLRHLDIAIEADGTFLAYKGINDNYTDVHSGTVPNNPGQKHEMARNLISDDPDQGCHFGYHVGALEYARGFGRVVVICRVDPEHVVCVPKDYSFQKMRVCKYEVVGEWSGETLPVNVDASDLPESDESYEAYEDSFEDDSYFEDPESDPVDEGESDDDHEPWLGDPAEVPGDLVTRPTVKPENPPTVIKKMPAPRLDKLDAKGLMKRSIEDLRRYASGRLKILGASKITGGKSTLVAKIMQVRRRKAK